MIGKRLWCVAYHLNDIDSIKLLQANDKSKEYVHMLNSTLTATERTMCAVLENNQKEDGVEIPEVLRPFMGGKSFIPFIVPPTKDSKGKKSTE